MEIPKQVQDKLAQYQGLQNQLQLVLAQKQQLTFAVTDTGNALQELEKAGDGRIYKMTGTLLIESTKEDSRKDLAESNETAEARVKVLEKQEKKLREKFEEMRKELSGMLGGGIQGDAPADKKSPEAG